MMRLRIVPALLSLLVLAGTAIAQDAPTGANVHTARVDSIFARWSSPTSPGCAVGVARQGRPVLSRAYGMADLEHAASNTPATIFEAGSVSKQFTAGAVVLLAQQGKLSLDDDVRKHVPELPAYEAPVTIRHLIHHTSGLRDWGTVVGAAGWPRTSRTYTHEHVLDVVSRQRSLNYAPGAEYSYTNSGYNLLAIIVARVSGQPFAEFSRQHIFKPLGMHQTQWRDDFTRIVKGRATAYTPREGAFHILMPFENVHGNGGLLTTVGDLLIWNENLERGTVGGPALLKELHRQGQLSNGRQIGYAAGLVIGTYRSVPEVSHGGATAGYRAYLTRYPKQGLSVALLCNTTNVDATALARRTANVFLDGHAPEATPPRTVQLSQSALASREGLYRNVRTHEPLRLSIVDGKLRLDRRTELVPLTASVFQIGSGMERLSFDTDTRARSGGFRLIDSDGDSVTFEPVAEAAPTLQELRAYEGEYHSDEAEADYSVRVRDGVLTLELRPHVRTPLTPSYADAFTTPSGSLVRFLRAPDGRVREMSFGLGRVRDLRFARRGD